MNASPPPRPMPRWLMLAAIVGFWSLPVLLFASQRHYELSLQGLESSWLHHARRYAPSAAVWAALTPLMLLLSARFPFDRGRILRAAIVHALAGVAVTQFHDLTTRLILFALHPDPGELVVFSRRQLAHLIRNPLPQAYLVVVALHQLFRFQQQIREKELNAARLQESLLAAQLETLKMNLRPHFLFNTLQSVSAYALRGDSQTVASLLDRLGGLLRAVFSRQDRTWTTLEEELAFLDQYLAFERLRFSDRLTVTRSVDPDALTARMPPMLLQPLVENAMKHGLAAKTDDGALFIEGRRAGADLSMMIADDGPGFPDPDAVVYGQGLTLTAQRLALLYPDRHQLRLENRETGGACVCVIIPFQAMEAAQT